MLLRNRQLFHTLHLTSPELAINIDGALPPVLLSTGVGENSFAVSAIELQFVQVLLHKPVECP